MPVPTNLSEIGQIALVVSDIQQALGFYRDVPGLSYLFEARPNLAFLMAGNTRIMLTLPEGNLVGLMEER